MNRLKSICLKSIEKTAGINYSTAKAFSQYRLHKSNRHFDDLPLLIYSMGKVGSQTIQESLKSSNIDMPIYHIHHLTHDYISSREMRYKRYFHQKETQYTDFDMLWRLQYLRDKLDKSLNGKRWKIVTLVRDPIALNLSTFFHHFNHVELVDSHQTYKIKSLYYDFDITVELSDTDTLLKLFLEKVDHTSPLSFFDDEIKKVFGIDLLSIEFPKERGYNIYSDKLVDILLIRLENLNECKGSAFKNFLNIEKLDLIPTNIGSKKAYAPLYKAFKDSVVLPDTYINEMYNSRFMRHFYTDEEISRFKVRWQSS